MLENVSNDLAFAYRMMKNRPGFTAIVVLVLAIGIGATTAMFGTINAALLSSLPFDEPDRLVMGRATFDGGINPWVSGYDYYDYRDQSGSFEHFAAFMFGGNVTVTGGAEAELVDCAFGTWDLFHALRVKPAAGRLFVAEEGVTDGAPVILVSHAYWQQKWGGASDAVGSSVIMDGTPHTVVGVLPAGLYFMVDADIWRLTFRDGPGAGARRWHNLLLFGRLKDGISLTQTRAEIDAISMRLQEQYPDTNEGKALAVTDLHGALVENVRPNLLMLMAAVSLVLLLGCGNVAGLLLARGQGRLSEIAVRSAMGASRPRLVRQLLTESMSMALVAGIVGVAFAFVFQGVLLRLLPLGRLGISSPTVDARVLLFALGVSLATGAVFGVVPALQGTLVNLAQQLRSGTRTTWARGSSILRNALVVLQVAISIMLLIGAGLLIRSLVQQTRVELGYDSQNVLTAFISLPDSEYSTAEERIAFFDSFIEKIHALPGVKSVGMVNRLPIIHRGGNIYLYPEDHVPGEGQASMSRSADFRYMMPGYLETMGIPIVAGRDVARTDTEESPRVMVVSQSLAEMFFDSENPLGKKLLVDMGELVEHEIVGVVPNTRLGRVTSEPFHAMYMSYYQIGRTAMGLSVRTQDDPGQVIVPIREILREMDRNIPLEEAMTMESIVGDSLSDFRVITSSLGLLSAIALLLALVGLYGVLAFYVSQRYHEIGIRMVLGANAFNVANLVLSRGLALVATGLAVGLVASYWATGLVQRLLFGIGSTDPMTFLMTALGFGSVALVACLIPAWRATRADPVLTLQAE
ncbi:MAG: ABC transporter permease [bacterium]|nr:ABC transporter permease [bacterium]